jgi:hypothetical protein
MSIYRFYILDSSETLQGPATRIDCADDSVAIKQAKEIVGGYFVELWQGERRIGRFDSKTQSKHA